MAQANSINVNDHFRSSLTTGAGRPFEDKDDDEGDDEDDEDEEDDESNGKGKDKDRYNSESRSPAHGSSGGNDENHSPRAEAGNGNHRGSDGEHGPSNAGTGHPNDGPTITVTVKQSNGRDGHRSDRGNAAGGSIGERPADPSPPADDPTRSSVVDVSMKDVQSGNHIDIDVSPPSIEDDAVAFDGVSATVNRDRAFTMRVTNSREPLPASPAFEPDEAATALGHVRLDHSVSNDEVADVSYTFRVKKSYLRATGSHQEEIALYRYEDGTWTELPTDVVGETSTHYVLAADSPGMSEFVVGAKRPAFNVYWADVDDESVDAGTSVTVSGRVTNTGGADGVYAATLTVDGELVAERAVTVAAGGTRQVNFEVMLNRPGRRDLAISGVPAGEITVHRPSRRRGPLGPPRACTIVRPTF